MNPAVSVVLPTFNRLRSLPAAMRSVLDQSYRDLELIVVDDASTEDVETVVTGFNDPRVHYLRCPVNGGAAAARNAGLVEARGRFIAFQDSDDLWLPGKLGRQVELLENQPPNVGAVVGLKILYGRDAARNYGPGRVTCAPDPKRRMTLQEDQLKRSLLDSRISVQNGLFRRDCLPDIAWFDPRARANEDWDFTIRLARHTRVLEQTEPVVLAMISPDSISTNARRNVTGYLRIMKNHGDVFRRYRRELGEFQFLLGRALLRVGRRKAGLGLIFRSLQSRPLNLLTMGKAGARRAMLRLSPHKKAMDSGR
ncbi:glycosyltransferase family 2 protein [Frigidibacter sp. ROC022]|uniref:glycosyltransferase family 2 protein n=1 Tax=Frigidibacter sp. ROC022 TaxID=2971796 RepID=UPI00215A211C|nr:glycosyltransferase family 2 protein [Frigidibacter sp. ROC022]MCR8726836.1 glycosyltransferase family 2 protein [Frigidibacter sp. ROC022]